MTLHRKIKHNEKVCRLRSRSQSGQRSKSCLSNNSKTTEANLTKHHRKIEHNGKVCRTRDLREHLLHTVTFLVLYFVLFAISGSIHFIDYEFAMYNYEHCELGIHFCEYAGKHPSCTHHQFNIRSTLIQSMFFFFFCFFLMQIQRRMATRHTERKKKSN